MLDVVARTTSIVFDLMQCFSSDCHDMVLVMFRCVYSCPQESSQVTGAFSDIFATTKAKKNSIHFINSLCNYFTHA